MARRDRLLADRRANAAVELALTLPILLVLLVGAFEIAVTIFVAGTLEDGVLAASRYGATGQDGGGDRETTIRRIIAERMLGLVDTQSVTIETSVYPSFAALGTPMPGRKPKKPKKPKSKDEDAEEPGASPSTGTPGLGGAGDIVLYDVTYETIVTEALVAPLLGAMQHHVTVAVRNEPY